MSLFVSLILSVARRSRHTENSGGSDRGRLCDDQKSRVSHGLLKGPLTPVECKGDDAYHGGGIGAGRVVDVDGGRDP